jgi:hypothetical protein
MQMYSASLAVPKAFHAVAGAAASGLFSRGRGDMLLAGQCSLDAWHLLAQRAIGTSTRPGGCGTSPYIASLRILPAAPLVSCRSAGPTWKANGQLSSRHDPAR